MITLITTRDNRQILRVRLIKETFGWYMVFRFSRATTERTKVIKPSIPIVFLVLFHIVYITSKH